mgnify:CR=1 FL=1
MNPGDQFVIADRPNRRHIVQLATFHRVYAECPASVGQLSCQAVPDADHPEWSGLPLCKTCEKRAKGGTP